MGAGSEVAVSDPDRRHLVGAAVDSRTTSSSGRTTFVGVLLRSGSMSVSIARVPISRSGERRVVSAGTASSALKMSSKPILSLIHI